MKFLYLTFLFYLLFASQVHAQHPGQINFNLHNGLPSNHVYQVIVDRYGYMWIATEKGVVKYNGYTFKTFGLQEGLPNADVWQLHEDKKGRIWFLSISNVIGYVQNDVYHRAYFDNYDEEKYPIAITDTRDGIAFLSKPRNSNVKLALYVEKNDSFKSTNLSIYGRGNDQYAISRGNIYKISDGKIYKKPIDGTKTQYSFISNIPTDYNIDVLYMRYVMLGDYMISYPLNRPTKSLSILNVANGNAYNLNFSDTEEQIVTVFANPDKIIMPTNKAVYTFDEKLNRTGYIKIDEILKKNDIESSSFTSLFNDKLWGQYVVTNNAGIYKIKDTSFFESSNFMPNYKYIGRSSDDMIFWYNKSKKQISTSLSGKSFPVSEIVPSNYYNPIYKIIPYNYNKSIVLSYAGVYWFYHHMQVSQPYYDTNAIKYFIRDGVRENFSNSSIAAYSGCEILPDNRLITTSQIGAFIYTKSNDTVIERRLLIGKFNDMQKRLSKNELWCYGDNYIFIYNLNGSERYVDRKALNNLGIKKIEKLLIDRNSGTILIKDYDKLFKYYPEQNKVEELLVGYNLFNASIFLQENTLIIVGKFGILFSKILPNGTIAGELLYENLKNQYYSSLDNQDVGITNEHIYLNSENSGYIIDIPSDDVIKGSRVAVNNNCRLLVKNLDNYLIIGENDTINLANSTASLQFDVINPNGNGSIRYYYKIVGVDTSFAPLVNNELFVSLFKPGEYYNLQIFTSDDIGKSIVKHIIFCRQPKWYQTRLWVYIFTLLAILSAIGAILLTVRITQVILSKKHAKTKLELELSNLRMTLELRSIYAQINPHFIFNTLNTCLLYIKRGKINEAYTHISAFSGLLRAYIKASRNKFITLKDEIDNLRNYITLQEARFKNRFHFNIITDSDLNLAQTLLPSLLLQPIVENAITHGLFHKETEGNLLIHFKKNADGIVCIVDDDGIGREKSTEIKKGMANSPESYGTDLIKDLIHVFNTYEPINISIEYIDKKQPLTGTTVVITIKYSNHDTNKM
ncbi:MAG: histidine kinase [Bacteroidetes bacterium]|nr:histidine kinase [Bacteroidota bacterium]